uniref:Uncharacterized protein n=1 Tax=Arundo donax TaxID=35708 RepID=A0A0A8YF02_ARUDO
MSQCVRASTTCLRILILCACLQATNFLRGQRGTSQRWPFGYP